MNPEKLDFKNNGYVIYRNVFNSDEILNFRHLVKSSLDKDLESNRASFSQEGKKKVYYTVGDNAHLHRHIEKHYKIKFESHINKSLYPDDIVAKCEEVGVKFINVD